ncbi:DUF4232 domain-containing protein [Streptomyces sp. NPDC057245]|uniref:DUF4232 domain-containing protein n=1 Tax=Streptomyces TaxID=1883 RepID=UPI001C1DD92C|nr:DUF4232 domain-containing protein [Streptomyces sp. A108]MBU6535769.1 DUF4232 domain-containing protein [Streptomyces sp. A108]
MPAFATRLAVSAAAAAVAALGLTTTATATTSSDEPVTQACTAANSDTTVSEVPRPLNHLLLTVTNTGDTPCNAYYAPALRFDDSQAATPVLESSKPQAVVTLAPGESGYAGILTSLPTGEGTNGHTATTLEVHFKDRADEDTNDWPTLTLPGNGVYLDSTATVTYWQSDLNDALSY